MKSISAETKKLLIFAFLLHLQTCLLTLICAQKQGFHMDEYFTFGLALCGVPLPDSCKILHASPKDFLSGTVLRFFVQKFDLPALFFVQVSIALQQHYTKKAQLKQDISRFLFSASV